MFYHHNKERELPEVNPVLKYIVFAFSSLFWLFGFCCIGIGVYALSEKGIEINSLSSIITDPAIAFLCVGSSIFCLTFFACVGALRENVCFLNFFSVVLAVSFMTQLLIGFVGFILSSQVEEFFRRYFYVVMESYRDDPDTQNIVDWGQQFYKCCGATSYTNWEVNKYFNCSSISSERCSVPWSCCIISENVTVINNLCGIGAMNLGWVEMNAIIYTDGCIPVLKEWFDTNIFTLAAVALALALPQILGILTSRILILQIKDEELFEGVFERRKRKYVFDRVGTSVM